MLIDANILSILLMEALNFMFMKLQTQPNKSSFETKVMVFVDQNVYLYIGILPKVWI